MCGIAGFSLNKSSRINARSLAHALLAEIEVRGRMSAGIAVPDGRGGILVAKDAVAGSNLPLKHVPRNSKTAILHTRYATKGTPQNNDNNHPVWSPDKDIALVHNGVIFNDMSIRWGALESVRDRLPEVDTACIPALIEEHGVDGIQYLSGDAAVAWLDKEDTDVLHLARIESSPLAYTNLEDGSLVFASLPYLLRAALDKLNLRYGQVFTMNERDYYQIRGGVIWDASMTPEPIGFRTGVAASTRNATSGGHGVTTQPTQSQYVGGNRAVYGDTPINKGGSLYSGGETIVDDAEITAEEALDRLEQKAIEMIKKENERRAITAATTAMAFTHPEVDEGEESFIPTGPKFFTIDTDGDVEMYDSLEELEINLLYVAARDMDPGGFGEQKTKWVNHFSDIGQVGDDGKFASWVEEPEELASYSLNNVEYIRDGVSLLAGMMGR